MTRPPTSPKLFAKPRSRRPPEATLLKVWTKPIPRLTKSSTNQKLQTKKFWLLLVKRLKATTSGTNPTRVAKGAPKCAGRAATRRGSLPNADAVPDATIVAEAVAASKKAEADLAAASVPSACH